MSRKVSIDDMHSSGVAPSLRNLGGKIEINSVNAAYSTALPRSTQ